MRLLLPLAAVPLLFACADAPLAPAPTRGPVDVADAAVDAPLLGVARDGDGFVLLTDGSGLVRVDDDGFVHERIAPGERGLLDLPYKDVAAVGDGVYLLLADQEGYRYDALAQSHQLHFCVEPGFTGEPDPSAPVLDQKNDALAVQGDLVVAAPRFVDAADGSLVESSLRSYRAVDGEPTGSVDVTALALALDGLALVDDEIWGVQGAALHRFARADGAHRGEQALDGVERARGLAVDDDAVWVLDGTTLRPFARP